jgi:hypothetical protein
LHSGRIVSLKIRIPTHKNVETKKRGMVIRFMLTPADCMAEISLFIARIPVVNIIASSMAIGNITTVI